MLGVIPYQVDVPMDRWPIANFLLIGGVVAVSVLLLLIAASVPGGGFPRAVLLDGLSAPGLLTHMFLHAGVLHLVGNMLFLWFFGNAVCAKVGNAAFIPLFVFMGLVAAMAHLMFDGGGPSGRAARLTESWACISCFTHETT